MRTFAITLGCLGLALLLTSFTPWTGSGSLPQSAGTVSTYDLTLAAGPLATTAYADAH
jgi:hypothetical protein